MMCDWLIYKVDYPTRVCLIVGGVIAGGVCEISLKSIKIGGGGLGQTLTKDKANKVQLVVFLFKTVT